MAYHRMYECDVCKKQEFKAEVVVKWYSAVLAQGDQIRAQDPTRLLSIDACSKECVLKAVQEALEAGTWPAVKQVLKESKK